MTNISKFDFLPNVPVDHVLKRLQLAGGKEIESGKLASPQSSAALVIDAFAPYIHAPLDLPYFTGLEISDWPASFVDIEYSARFPWRGGRHPWLDAVVKTSQYLIGIESKRFEPYRDAKSVTLSEAYWRDVWGDKMAAYELLRNDLNSKHIKYKYLDAAQLVKHAFGLRTDAVMRLGVKPILVYLHVNSPRNSPVKITAKMIADHQDEIDDFSKRVKSAEVEFFALSYSDWLTAFTGKHAEHAKALNKKYTL